ncbi:MAG: class I SAM-dependent RNA methyltransferase [Eubacteriales bacterium]|nr:class I SAM-dependent RNA methyltransferase [Eubacteriales bacterium]
MTEEKNTCVLSGTCGGCFYYGISYEEQLEKKNGTVKGLLDGAVRGDYLYEGILRSPLISGYRNKMEYSFGDEKKNGPLTLGLHKKRSFYDVIDTDCCGLVHEDFNVIVRETRRFFDELGATYKDKRTHRGFLRYLLIRRTVNTGEILVDLVTTSQPLIPVMAHALINDSVLYDEEALLRGEIRASTAVNTYDAAETVSEWARLLLSLKEKGAIEGKLSGILHTIDDAKADAVKNDGTRVLYGTDSITEELLGLRFCITPFSFFQTNSRGAEVLYEKVREYVSDSLSENSTVYDLYSGTGTIAQMMAPKVKHVIGVEIVPEAVEAAKENAAGNGLANCEFIAGDVLKVLDEIEEKPDVIILDPPRDGIHPKALPKILAYGVKTIIYVSCKCESLARDLVPMQAAGYRLVKACAVDQFPWTRSVETIALLSRQELV